MSGLRALRRVGPACHAELGMFLLHSLTVKMFCNMPYACEEMVVSTENDLLGCANFKHNYVVFL